MDTTRRSFLGMSIGTVIGSSIPFKAQTYIDKITLPHGKIGALKRWVRAMELPESQLFRFKITVLFDEVGWLRMPALGTAKHDLLKENFHFATKPLVLTRQLECLEMRLIDDQGFVLARKDFNNKVIFNPDDTMVCNYDFTYDFPIRIG